MISKNGDNGEYIISNSLGSTHQTDRIHVVFSRYQDET